MRRALVVLCFMVFCELTCPARADAYIWKWLNDLSGPQFVGWDLDWRVFCTSDVVRENRSVLVSRRNDARAFISDYNKSLEGATGAKAVYIRAAVQAGEKAAKAFDAAIESLDKGDEIQSREKAQLALNWRRRAASLFEAAHSKSLPDNVILDDLTHDPVSLPDNDSNKQRMVGVTFSFCVAKPDERRRSFASANFGFGYDAKERADGRDDGNRMVTLGGSYHAVVTPYLTVGTGGGVALFSSAMAPSFQKLYVQPYIIDVKPLAPLGSESRRPWLHVFFVRYSTLVFPTGFEPGRFGGVSDDVHRFQAELVHSIGVHADLEPVMRAIRGK